MALAAKGVSDLNPRTPVLLRLRGVVTPNEAADVLAVLYPALLRFAGNQLRSRQLDVQLAEDLVQEAAAAWFGAGARFRTSAEMNRYLRLAITSRAMNMRGRRTDALDQDPLGLEPRMAEPEE